MKQLLYIIHREIAVKFKSRSFYLFALVSPLLFVLPVLFSIFAKVPSHSNVSTCKVGIISNSLSYDTIEYRGIKFFTLSPENAQQVRRGCFNYTDILGVVDMRDVSFYKLHEALQLQLYVPKDRANIASQHIHDVESFINSEFVYQFGRQHSISSEQLLRLTNFASLSLVYSNSTDNMVEANKAKAMAFGLGMLLYIMFILYNNNIVKSISEEKSNKLAEVLSMFVKPSRLMTGKILGLAVASLVQLLIWLLAFVIYIRCSVAIGRYLHYISAVDDVSVIDFSSLFSESKLLWLVMFFIMGSLLNGSLSTIFAICSSRSRSSIPIVLSNMLNLISIYFGMYAAINPFGSVTVFASYFPLTSYLVIPAILPYGLSFSHIILSAALLIIVSLLLLYLSARLYRRFLIN